MRLLIVLMALLAFALSPVITQANTQATKPVYAQTATKQATLTPQAALQKLIEGNRRFLAENQRNRNYLTLAKFTSVHGQHPFAATLSCVDSRSTPEIVFDQGIGDIFSTRIAGNVASPAAIASLQFATVYAGAKVIVVLGHTQCGAVKAACTSKASGQLKSLVANISQAVSSVEGKTGNKNCDDLKLIDAIAKQNVINQIHAIINDNEEIADLVKKNELLIVGAMLNIRTGKVSFFNIDGTELRIQRGKPRGI